MRTTIDLPDSLFRRAKSVAALRGLKLKDLIASLVEKGLDELGQEEPVRLKRQLPPPVRPATGVTYSLTNEEIHAILDQEDVSHSQVG